MPHLEPWSLSRLNGSDSERISRWLMGVVEFGNIDDILRRLSGLGVLKDVIVDRNDT